MTPHDSPHPTAGHHTHPEQHDDDGLAELLELDAEILDPLLEEVLDWVGQHVRGTPDTVADIGAGTGAGSRLQ